MNGYSVVFRKVIDDKESKVNVSIFIDKEDFEKNVFNSGKNELIKFGIKKLKEKLK